MLHLYNAAALETLKREEKKNHKTMERVCKHVTTMLKSATPAFFLCMCSICDVSQLRLQSILVGLDNSGSCFHVMGRVWHQATCFWKMLPPTGHHLEEQVALFTLSFCMFTGSLASMERKRSRAAARASSDSEDRVNFLFQNLQIPCNVISLTSALHALAVACCPITVDTLVSSWIVQEPTWD